MHQQILLKPTGPYTVGISRFDFHDENRREINHPNGRMIPIPVNADDPYFNGTRSEIDAFWEKLLGDIRTFLQENEIR